MSQYGYLAHYGIKGQRWGVKNGPPYPIGSGTKQRIRKQTQTQTQSKEKQSFDLNKARKVGLIALGTGATLSAIAALTAGAAGMTYLAIKNPDAVKGIVKGVLNVLGNVIPGALKEAKEELKEMGTDLAKSGLKKLKDEAASYLKENGELKVRDNLGKAAEAMANLYKKAPDFTVDSYKNGKKVGEENLVKAFIDKNWDALSKDSKASGKLADAILEFRGSGKDGLAAVSNNSKMLNIVKKEGWTNRSFDKTATKIAGVTGAITTLTGAVTSAANVYSLKDRPMVKDGMKYVNSQINKYKEKKKGNSNN